MSEYGNIVKEHVVEGAKFACFMATYLPALKVPVMAGMLTGQLIDSGVTDILFGPVGTPGTIGAGIGAAFSLATCIPLGKKLSEVMKLEAWGDSMIGDLKREYDWQKEIKDEMNKGINERLDKELGEILGGL
ncbi:MAG: hypothetical protein FWC00_05010 [Firmicutes bacterium]|nr:hypothetical protein [Bacillota bacterium]